MRYVFYCLLFLISPIVFGQATGTIQIGSGTNTSSGGLGLPVTNYDYSYSQQIISASEYASSGGIAGNITKLRYKPSAVGDELVWNDLKIYIANTTKTQFSSNTDWVPFADLTLVFNGVVTPSPVDGQWFEITFTTPFAYIGGNIVVAVHENAMGWEGGHSFSSYISTPNSGIVWRADVNNINPATATNLTAEGRTSNLAQIQFVGAMAACVAPSNIAVSPTVDGGVITWTPNTNGVSYDWVVVANNAGVTSTPQASGNALVGTATISGLQANTPYDLYIKANCSGTDGVSAWSNKIDFLTTCGIVTDLSENFDAVAPGTVPSCWTFIGGDPLDWFAGYGEVIDYNAATAPNCFTIVNMFDNASDYVLVSPVTDNLGNGTKQLRFFAAGDYDGIELIVGTMSNPNQLSTFTPLAGGTIQLTDQYVEYVFDLPAGTDDYFAFKHGNLDTFESIYIDDVNLTDPPICSGVDFGTGEATEITNVQAKLSWISSETNFDIEYGEINFVQGAGTLLTNVSNNYVLSNLDEYTEYSFYVRSNCGADGTSVWRGPFNFVTEKVTTSPWFDGFATGTADGWNNISSSVFNLSNDVAALMPMMDYVIYKNLYTAAGNGSGFTSLNVGPILTGDKLTFNYKMANYSSPYGPVDASAGSIDVFISTDFGHNYTLLANLPYNEVDGWQEYETPLNSYVGQLVKLKFVANYNYVEDDYIDHYVAFDNFYIGSCQLPTIPTVTNTTINTASISWEANATDVFEIEYGLTGFVPGTGTIVSVTGNSTVLNNLILASNYEFYIRKNCGTNNSPWLGQFKFTTACTIFTTGFTENFDTTAVGSSNTPTIPVCWSFIDGGIGYGTVVGSNFSSSPNSFYLYNNADTTNPYILVSPETQNLNDGLYRVRFKAKSGSNNYKLKFGTMSNKLDATTFTQLQEFSLTENYQEFIVYLPVTTNDYFAFKHGQASTYQSIYIDDVVYEPNPACVDPISLGALISLGDLSANLYWSGPDTATNNSFEIEWGDAGFTQGTGTVITSTTYSAPLTNLEAGESYSFYVRRICSGGNTVWVGPFTFLMDYCSSIPTSNDGNGIENVTIAGVSMDSTENVTYHDFTDQVISFNAGELIPASVTFNTGYTYGTNLWIDLNNNGVFENATELFFVGESLSDEPTTLNVSFTVPDDLGYQTGNYRMRIGTADSGQNPPNPCYSGSWGVTVDLLVNITFPCIQPSNIDFVDVGFDYVTIDWQGQGNSNFELEYGLTGFAQGTGTVVQNVTKPYTLNNLISGKTYDFYIRKKCGNVFSDWSTVATTYVFCDTPEPTGASSQTLIQDETFAQLIINGVNLKFYADPGLTIELPASTVLQTSGTFFVTQTINCESDSYLIVDVTVIPRIAQPIVNPIQNFCNGGTLNDIPVTSLPGATVVWYATSTSTTPLPSTTNLVTGTYYVVQTDGTTTSHRIAVTVTVNPTPVDLVSQPIHLCGSTTFGNLVVNNLPGATVRWYVSLTATTPINNNVPVTTGTYYATQAFGICESQRVAYQISQFDALDKPLAVAQVFCGTGTVANLVAEGVNGAQLMWYSSSTAVNALSSTAALSNGTYYVSQTINGCLSERRAVAVRVISLAAPQVGPFTVCGGGEISDLYISAGSDVTFKWYISPSSTTELAQNTPLVEGIYFVERVQLGCVSARTPVQVTIGAIPTAPTGAATQSFIEGSTIANLILNQSNLVWYATHNDSQNGVNPLQPNMPLVNGATYYAVIIGTNGCPSLPFAVTVVVFLSNDEFDKEGLKYYPNPVNDVLNVNYVESIKFVEVFDLLGKRVKTLNTNNQNIQIDLSDLASGTYMIQLKTESKTQFIKVIKK